MAKHYGATVIADASLANKPVTPPTATGDPKQALQAVARQAGENVAYLGDNTYQVYRP